MRFAECQAAEHVEDGRPAAEKPRGVVAWTVIERMHPVTAKAEKIPRSPRTCRDGRSRPPRMLVGEKS